MQYPRPWRILSRGESGTHKNPREPSVVPTGPRGFSSELPFDPRWYPWVPVGIPSLTAGYRGKSMANRGFPWESPRDPVGIPSVTMGSRGKSMRNRGNPWEFPRVGARGDCSPWESPLHPWPPCGNSLFSRALTACPRGFPWVPLRSPSLARGSPWERSLQQRGDHPAGIHGPLGQRGVLPTRNHG